MRSSLLLVGALLTTACGNGTPSESVLASEFGVYQQRNYNYQGDGDINAAFASANGTYRKTLDSAGVTWDFNAVKPIGSNTSFKVQYHGADFGDFGGRNRSGGPVVTSDEGNEAEKQIWLAGAIPLLSAAEKADFHAAGVSQIKVIVTLEYSAKPMRGARFVNSAPWRDGWMVAGGVKAGRSPSNPFVYGNGGWYDGSLEVRPYGEWFGESVAKEFVLTVDDASWVHFGMAGRWVQMNHLSVLILRPF